MKQVRYFDIYSNGKDTVTLIVYDDTHDYIDTPTDIRIKQSTEKALSDFRKLSKLDKYMECQQYGVIISNTDIATIDGYLTTKIMEIYNTKFVFITLAGQVINCYELQ